MMMGNQQGIGGIGTQRGVEADAQSLRFDYLQSTREAFEGLLPTLEDAAMLVRTGDGDDSRL